MNLELDKNLKYVLLKKNTLKMFLKHKENLQL